MTKKISGGAGQDPTPPATKIAAARLQTRPEPTVSEPTAKAVRYTASANSAFDMLIVERCPRCSYSHAHRAYEQNTSVFERAPHCAPHSTYLVVVDKVVPVAPPLRTRHGRAA